MTTVAVTGAAGAIGAQVVRGLADSGAVVAALVRRPGAAPRGPGISEHLAPYDDPDALATAMRGADTLVFIGSDGEADRVLLHHQHILKAAAASEVRRIVLLSSQDADEDSPFCYATSYSFTEEWLQATCAEPIVVRAGLYGEFFGHWVLAAARGGALELPMRGAGVAPIARSDVAAALVAATTVDMRPEAFTITGPQRFEIADLAAEASRLAGHPIPWSDCTEAAFTRHLVDQLTQPWWTYAFTTLFAAIREERFGTVTDDLHALTGSRGVAFGTTLGAAHRSVDRQSRASAP
jgi:NAD(P)H dehydrogenase (quinone)